MMRVRKIAYGLMLLLAAVLIVGIFHQQTADRITSLLWSPLHHNGRILASAETATAPELIGDSARIGTRTGYAQAGEAVFVYASWHDEPNHKIWYQFTNTGSSDFRLWSHHFLRLYGHPVLDLPAGRTRYIVVENISEADRSSSIVYFYGNPSFSFGNLDNSSSAVGLLMPR